MIMQLALSLALVVASNVGADSRLITLDAALAEAARANSDVLLAEAARDSAELDVFESYAGVLPRLDLSATVGYTVTGDSSVETPVPDFAAMAASPNDPVPWSKELVALPASSSGVFGLGLTLQFPIFDGGRNWNLIRRAKAASRAANHALSEATIALSFEVTRRFFELIKAQETVRVLEETMRRSDEIERRAQANFSVGRGSRFDVLIAKGNAGDDRISVEAGRARVIQASAELAQILGREADGTLGAAMPAELVRPAVPLNDELPPIGNLLAIAQKRRALLAERAEELEASELGRSIAHGAWFPSVAAQGSYNRAASTLAGSDGVLGDPSRQFTATAQIVAQWNLFDGRRTIAEERRASIVARQARARLAKAREDVANEIVRARAYFLSRQRAVTLALDNLASAQQGVALARDRLELGAGRQLELRDASLKYTQARLALVSARIDTIVARADLNRALGGSPSRRGNGR